MRVFFPVCYRPYQPTKWNEHCAWPKEIQWAYLGTGSTGSSRKSGSADLLGLNPRIAGTCQLGQSTRSKDTGLGFFNLKGSVPFTCLAAHLAETDVSGHEVEIWPRGVRAICKASFSCGSRLLLTIRSQAWISRAGRGWFGTSPFQMGVAQNERAWATQVSVFGST